MTYLRYRGSHFKTAWQTSTMVEEFRPMAARGWQCHLVLERLPDDPAWLQGFEDLKVQIHCLPRPRKRFDWHTIRLARSLFRRLRPDAVVCENIHNSPLLAAALARVPVRLWIKHAMNAGFESGRPQGLKARLAPTVRLSAMLATRVMAVSRAVAGELRSLGIPESKILLRLNPRQTGHRPPSLARPAAREQFGYTPDDVVFVSTGHAVPVKGWDLLLPAFAQAAAAQPRARLLLVGGMDRPQERAFAEALRGAAVRLNIADRITFTGHTEDVAGCLAASDVFVMPSRSEGFSYALIEALEAGLPCIATRVGVAEDVIRPGANGILVARCQVAPLAEAMRQLCQDDALRTHMAAGAALPECIPSLPDYAEQLATDIASLRRAAGQPLPASPETESLHA